MRYVFIGIAVVAGLFIAFSAVVMWAIYESHK